MLIARGEYGGTMGGGVIVLDEASAQRNAREHIRA
jgi:hypothetical protein